MREKEPQTSFTDSVRDFSHKIVDSSSDILTIDTNKLEDDLLKELKNFKSAQKGSDPFATESLSPENELGLTFFLDVVNFCYRNPFTQNDYVYTDHSGKTISRATGLKAAMTNADINWGNTKEVASLTPNKWAEIIQLENNKDFFLGADRGKRISELAGKLAKSGFKNITDFLIFAEYDTQILLPILNKSGYFNDEFQKRSQLAVSMMNGILKRRFNKEITGTESLTVMADYRLPQVMYNFGVIKLSDNLFKKLLNQEIIETGTPEELSLRASSIVVGEKLSELMDIPEGDVDTLLWTLSQKMSKEGKLPIPHMLVATDKY